MPNWSEVLNEIQQIELHADIQKRSALDTVRRKYLKELSIHTGRNVIAYYSGWLQNEGRASAIGDDDKNGFMNSVHLLDRNKGLDLLIHTPGGNLAATESIVDYLLSMFNGDIRAFIPQLAMSGGTMMACACKEIWMGKESNIGPIDPQFGGVPAHGVMNEFKRAIKETKEDPSTIPIWQTIVAKYNPAFIGECEHAITLASDICEKWLERYMFAGSSTAKIQARAAVTRLNNHDETKTHSRHIHIDEAKSFGLNIKELESDKVLQDLVLTIHHSYMHTFARSGVVKIVENHDGKAIVYRGA